MKTKPVSKLRCSEVARYVCENLDEQLNSRKCLAIKKHLQNCPQCSTELDSLKKTVFLYRTCPTPKIASQSHKKFMADLSSMFKKK
jgi:hypothetical protein